MTNPNALKEVIQKATNKQKSVIYSILADVAERALARDRFLTDLIKNYSYDDKDELLKAWEGQKDILTFFTADVDSVYFYSPASLTPWGKKTYYEYVDDYLIREINRQQEQYEHQRSSYSEYIDSETGEIDEYQEANYRQTINMLSILNDLLIALNDI